MYHCNVNQQKGLLFNWKEKLLYAASLLLSKWINRKQQLRSFAPLRILVIREDEIGDMCYSLHVFEMLSRQYPSAQITVLCKPFVQSLLTGSSYIHHLTTSYKELQGTFDCVIDLRGSWKSLWYTFTNQPTLRLDRGTIRYQNKQKGKHPHEVITNRQVVEPIINESLRFIEPKLSPTNLHRNKAVEFVQQNKLASFAILHTGARKQLRKWNGFAILAIHLKEAYNLDIVFTGDSSEVVEVQNWQQQIPFQTYSIAGNFSLMELAALCQLAKVYIGNESGPLHIASIVGIPTVGLFGPGEPTVFYPWGQKSKVVHHVLECNPCNQISCVQSIPCIERISVLEVMNEIQKIIS